MREPHAARREPLLRIARREPMPASRAWLVRLAAVLLALLTGGVIVLALGHNPVAVYADMVRGSLMTKTSLRETVKIAVPLLGAALAIAPAFRMKFWNIGAEGQILMGGIAASYVALFQYQNMSRGMLLFCMFVAGVVAGGLWGVVPAVFKAKWGTNETLFTLMFNYIALGVEQYLQNGPWRDPKGTGFPIIAMFDRVARLPKVFGVHIGWIIVLALVVFMYVYMNFSKQGYEIAVVGESVRTAQYVGMSVGRVIVRTMFLSGAVAGLVGVLNVAGADYTLNASTAGGVGFTAITVAWLAKLNPFAMIGIAFFLAILSKGSNTIQTDFKIPASAAEVLTGTILFFLLGCEFFLQYRIVWRGKHTPEKSGKTPEDENPAGGSCPGAPDGEGGAV